MPVLQHTVLSAFHDSTHFPHNIEVSKYFHHVFSLLRDMLTNDLGRV